VLARKLATSSGLKVFVIWNSCLWLKPVMGELDFHHGVGSQALLLL
jgi:hypothetical protein